MCVCAFNWQPGTNRPLRLLSNRDEFFARPALPMAWWAHNGQAVLSGRDERAGGTWLAMNELGRLALVTNFRRGLPEMAARRSRGDLPLAWLDAPEPFTWAERLPLTDYAPFNLIGFDTVRRLAVYLHWSGAGHTYLRVMEAGVHGLSNGRLNEPWPKTLAMLNALHSPHESFTSPPTQLLDGTPAPLEALPNTGLDAARERWLSAVFIKPTEASALAYGTRCSTVVEVQAHGATLRWQAREWQHTPVEQAVSLAHHTFTSPPSP